VAAVKNDLSTTVVYTPGKFLGEIVAINHSLIIVTVLTALTTCLIFKTAPLANDSHREDCSQVKYAHHAVKIVPFPKY
jgi:hypothetical protein